MIEDVLTRNQNTAFQFSGGRDSLAALYALRKFWDRFTVYHIDSGDQFPETKAVVDRVAKNLPRYVRLQGDVTAVHAAYGLPSDVVPTNNSWFGRKVSGAPLQLQDRYDCCYRTVMKPMYDRMKADGVTAIIRGVRKGDYVNAPTSHGDRVDGFEFCYPIADWTAFDVMAFLKDIGVAPPPFYAHGLDTTLECMSCSAWWDNNRAAYLKEKHPEAHGRYMTRLKIIRTAVVTQMNTLDLEVANA